MKTQRRFEDMNIFRDTAGIGILRLGKQSLALVLSMALLFATLPQSLSAQDQDAQDAQAAPADDTQAPAQDAQAPAYAQQTPEQLQRLVAPIALYRFAGGADPDSVHVSRASRRSRPMGAGESRFEG